MLWLLLVLAVALALLALALFDRVTVFEYERALRYRGGRFDRVLGPGRYWLFKPTTTVKRLDVRPRVVSVPGQEVLSADAVTLRVSLAAEYEIADPAVAVNEVENFESAFYLVLQLALREIVGSVPIDDLLEKRAEIGPKLLELSAEPAAALGLNVRRVDLKDIMFPGELKKTFARVVTARKEALASLERARGETAALRNLANAARLIDDNPALMQLRLLQQLGESGGNTIVLGLPASTTPLPLRDGDPPAELPPLED